MFLSVSEYHSFFFFFFQAEDGIRDYKVTGVQTCALPISISLSAALAARERDRGVLAQMRDVEVLQQLGEARLDLGRLESLQLEDGLHVLFHREAPEHRILLRQIRDAQPRAAVDRQVRELGGGEGDAAGVDRYQPDDHVEAGRLAPAGVGQQPHPLAAGGVERDVLHHGARLVALAQALRAQLAQPGALIGLHFFSASAGLIFGWITARTRPPRDPLPALTEKKSERWSTRM